MNGNISDTNWQQREWDRFGMFQRNVLFLRANNMSSTEAAFELMSPAKTTYDMERTCLQVRFAHAAGRGLTEPDMRAEFLKVADERTKTLGRPLEINMFVLAKLRQLSPLERDVAADLAAGKNLNDIAYTHVLNSDEMRLMKESILTKTGVFTRTHLAQLLMAEANANAATASVSL